MKKNSNRSVIKAVDWDAFDETRSSFEIFKSRVANAVLDYMEVQNDRDLLECLEKASIFLNNTSIQIEKVFDNQRQTLNDQNDLFETGEDLFLPDQRASSSSIH